MPLKPPQTNFARSNSSDPSPNSPPAPSHANFQNTLTFRLHHKLNHPKDPLSPNKQIIRKYYGKKVVYLENHQEVPSALHRSRLFRSINLKGGSSGQLNFKCKGDLVILGSPLSYKESRPVKAISRPFMYFKREDPLHPLLLKKFLKGCLGMSGNMRLGLGPLRFMLGLKQISLDIQTRSDIERLARLIPNFRGLEAIKLRYVDPNYTIASSGGRSSSQSNAHWLFSRVYKLPRLKDFRLETSQRTIENYFTEVQGDVHNVFYKKNFKGKTHVKMYFAWDFLGNKKSQALAYFLRDAEALKIDCGGDTELPCKNKEYCLEKRQEKHNKRNTVEILSNFGCKEVNLKEVLYCCESLETLHVKSTRDEITWKSDFSRETVRLEKLQNVTLDFSISKLDSQRNSSHPLLNMLNYFRENCYTLQDMSLFLCLAKIDDQTRLAEFLNQIKENSKIKKLELCAGDRFHLLSPQMVLPFNENLESFGIYACSPSGEYKENRLPHSVEWDNIFQRNEENSPKEVQMNALRPLKFPSVGSIGGSESPKMLEALDVDPQCLIFDFIYDLLQEIIEKKHMKKLAICTDIPRRNDYLKQNEVLSQQKRIEPLLASLKGSDMEEIFIGKLDDFPSNFIFSHRGLKTERMFWSEEQLLTMFKSEDRLQKLDSYFRKMIHPVFGNKNPF